MLFNSFAFLVFLPVVLFFYWFIFKRSLRWQNLFLLVASYFFYAFWSWKFLGLLALSTVLDYIYGFCVASPDRKRAKLFLVLSLINNLGILCIFKYYDFFVAQISEALGLIGLHSNLVLLNLVLPIGISFYTFHGMSYVFDIYRGKQKPVSSFVDYAVFVGFFPLLVAGPIERANHLLPQVQKLRVFDYNQAVQGCRLMLWGLFKKIVIADNLAIIVDHRFNNYENQSAVFLIIGIIAFSFQIYGDFSGYTDIALGVAKMLGFELLSNFKFPYFSRDVAEFWRRWHISLSSWFRDYLYIPLGGSKDGKAKAVRNTFIIFLLSGFWHGASWNFITWGFIHACGFLPLLILGRHRKHVSQIVAHDRKLPNLRELFQMTSTFVFVSFAWVFFRAENLTHAWCYLKEIIWGIVHAPSQFLHIPFSDLTFLLILPLVLGDWWLRRDERNLRTASKPVQVFIYLVIGTLVFLAFGHTTNFIYFQF